MIIISIVFEIAGSFIPKMYVSIGGMLEFGLFYARNNLNGEFLSYGKIEDDNMGKRLKHLN